MGKGLNASQGRIPAGASATTRHRTPLRCRSRSAAVWRGTPVAVRWPNPLAETRPGRLGRALPSVGAPCREVSQSPSDPDLWSFRRRSVEPFANDLRMGQGVVLGRAVSTLRSVETHPSTLGSSIFFAASGAPALASGSTPVRSTIFWPSPLVVASLLRSLAVGLAVGGGSEVCR